MPIIDLGKVVGDPGASMRFRGEWNSESEYFNNASYIDAVTHNGSLWICKVTNTNQVPATGTYWGIGAQGMAEDNMVFSAYSAFPSVGDENKLYIDNTVNPALIYIWNGSAYIPAGGGGEVAAEDVTYNNASSALEAQTVQEAIDENAEAISALNSRIQLDTIEMSVPKGSFVANSAYRVGNLVIFSAAINMAETVNSNEVLVQFEGISAKSRFDFAIRDSNTTIGDGALLAGTNGIIANGVSLNPGGYFCAGAFVVD